MTLAREIYEVRLGNAWVRCPLPEWFAFPPERRRVCWRPVEAVE